MYTSIFQSGEYITLLKLFVCIELVSKYWENATFAVEIRNKYRCNYKNRVLHMKKIEIQNIKHIYGS